jgi:4-hydroxy-2-oxoheptanedioate aldolase
MRALQLHSGHSPESYFRSANSETLAIAMIETRAAFAALDAILATDGIRWGLCRTFGSVDILVERRRCRPAKRRACRMLIAEIAAGRTVKPERQRRSLPSIRLTPLFGKMGYRLDGLEH